jgi:tetratricopeptide (TPR) repeat protein
MGDLSIQLLTRDDQDLATLRRAILPKSIAENIVGYTMLIRSDPTRVSLHDDVALLYRQLGQHEEEIAHYETSVRLLPNSPAAHVNLGAAMADAGKLEGAIVQYRRALQLRADYPLARANLAHALLRQGKLEDAKEHYREALRLEPGNADAHNNIGFIFLEQGHSDTAISHFRDALMIDASSAGAHYNAGRALRRRGELTESVEHFQQALRASPDWTPALVNLAWLFATAPDDGLRRADEAVRLAERAAELTGNRDAAVLDVLAAAYAAAGQFNRAVDAAGAALRLVPQDANLSAIRLRRALYEQRVAYRVRVGNADEQQDLLTPYR